MDQDRLALRRTKLQAALKETVAKEKAAAKRNNAKRQSLAGRIALEHSARDEAFSGQLRALLDQALTSDKDRALFDLPSKSEEKPADTSVMANLVNSTGDAS